MTLELNSVEPPRLAVWLISLFVLAEEAESIQGDLLEEFSLIASKSGTPFARRWHWRQAIKTVPQLAGAGFRSAPWLTSAAIVGGFLLRKLLGPLVGPAVFGVLERYQVFEHHFNTYLFFASTGMDIAHVITFLFVGFMVALAARGREMLATMSLGLLYAAMALVASVYVVAKTGDAAYLWRLTWYFADPFAIVIAGAIIRSHRNAATARHSNA
ncbi:MAG: permease prefix domain 2-containing transporter [Terracidiphilus sp.]